jgi:phosphoglycolate phosphatase-like HAD superfamily hydrolase
MHRRSFIAGIAAAGVLGGRSSWGQGDPLPSWNEGPHRRAILDFIARAVILASPDFVPVAERIACFDNDGTLWTEQPNYVQVIFAEDRVRALASRHPQWKTLEPFKWVLEGDRDALAAMGEKALLQVIAETHAGLNTEEFRQIVLQWIASARHPRFKRLYTDLVYQPMLELLALLRANQFKTYIVSGVGVEFMRPWTERTYGIPPEQVVGSSGVNRYVMPMRDKPVLLKEGKVEFIDDGPGKAEGINRFIGRRPILSFGNSDGDQQMLEWTAVGTGARFMGLVHHTDAVREYAYDRNSPVGRLDRAWDEAVRRGWSVVDMKNDWKVIFPFELK